jgi:hypothetical protein
MTDDELRDDELRKECSAMWYRQYASHATVQEDIQALFALCKRQQAQGLREALSLANSTDCYTGNKFDLELFEEQCLAKAKERDG